MAFSGHITTYYYSNAREEVTQVVSLEKCLLCIANKSITLLNNKYLAHEIYREQIRAGRNIITSW